MVQMCALVIVKGDDGTVHTQIGKYNMPVEIIAMQLRAFLSELDDRYNAQAQANITDMN